MRSRLVSSFWSSLAAAAILMSSSSSSSNTFVFGQDVCSIGGINYARGERIDLESRCGLPEMYPCVCNPDVRGQIDCPFCSFATNTPNLLRCIRDGETAGFRDINNVGMVCTCDASDPSNPVPSCQVDPTAGTTCEITLPDGGTVTRNVGDEIGRESRCGATSEYPCICNPNLPGQIECPYCSFATPGDDLICLADGETKTFTDMNGIGRTCSCSAPESPAFPMEFECTDAPTRAPIPPGAQCTYTRPDGSMFSIDHGASIGNQFRSRCGDPAIWPCFCNVQLANQIDCPYCAVPDPNSVGFLCAADGEVLNNVENDDGTFSNCMCTIVDPFTEPILDCTPTVPTPTPLLTCAVNLPNGQQQIFQAGDEIPIGLTTAGPCGDSFPYICNPALSGDTDLEYPYCQFTTNTGSTVCARGGDTGVIFTNADGDQETCDCLYVTASIGAQQSCSPGGPPPTPRPTARPTMVVTQTPVEMPTVQTADSGAATAFFGKLGVFVVVVVGGGGAFLF